MKRNTIRRKLLLLTLLPPLLLLVVIVGYFIHQDNKFIHEALLERGVSVSRYLASAAEYGVITGNTQQLTYISSSVLQGDIVALKVYDFDGAVIFVDGEVTLARRESGDANSSGLCGASESFMLFCAPIVLDAMPVSDYEVSSPEESIKTVGRVELTLSTRIIAQKRGMMLRWSLLLVVAVMLLAVFLSRRMERQLVEPLSSLGRVVDKVRHGDLQAKVNEGATGELLALQQGINVMIDALAHSKQNMQLEIDSATENLRDALQQLEQRNYELQVEQQRAESASLAKSQFLATMSHEIRTPLSGMIGMLQLLRDGSEDRHQLDYIDSVENAAQSLRQLIDDILDFSRLEVGKLAIQNQPFSPLAVIEEVMVMLAPSAHHKNLEFVLDMGAGLPQEVVGDPLRLRQILINLVANAIKFTHAGEVVVHARPSKEAGNNGFCFEICDSGIGISREKQGMVFESFTQIDAGDARNYGGSGLGATVSRELVRMMGGEIGLESELGRGSCFWFELPWGYIPQSGGGLEADTRPKVLLLEAHTASAAAIGRMLECEHMSVQAVESEERLWQVLASDEFDWVMVGENAPASTHTPLLDRLANELPPSTRLVQLSFVNGVRDDNGRVEHVTKPLLPTTLQRLLRREEVIPERHETLKARSLMVLLAEDDEINARVISHFLRKGNHRVEWVVDGEAALQVLSCGEFDCVLMDMRMPGLDGLEATRRWRAQEGEGHLPIIALTANASEEDKERCEEAGMDDYLTKPVESETLLASLERHCR